MQMRRPPMPNDCVVIRLPDPRALRVLARSVLFAVALLSLPWLRAAEAPARPRAGDACGATLQAELLLRDLCCEGLLAPGARAVLLGSDGDCHTPALKQDDAMRPISLRRMLMLGDSSVDLLLDFSFVDEAEDRFGFADRVLKNGGIVAAPIGSASTFRLPQNYRVVYIRRFTETFVGIKKIAHASDDGNAGAGMEVASPAALNLEEGVLSGHLAETAKGEFKNLGRKLLLSDYTRMPAAHAHQGWFKMHRPRIRVYFAALWNAKKLQPALVLSLQDKAVPGAQQQLQRFVRLSLFAGAAGLEVGLGQGFFGPARSTARSDTWRAVPAWHERWAGLGFKIRHGGRHGTADRAVLGPARHEEHGWPETI